VTFSATYVALWAVAICEGILILAILQQLAKLRQLAETGASSRKDQLPTGATAPEFLGIDERSGQQVGLRNLDGQGGTLLFLSTTCFVCQELVDSIGHLPTADAPIIAFCQGEAAELGDLSKRLGAAVQLLSDESGDRSELYHVSTYPTAVVVDGQRTIRAYGHPRNLPDLKRLYAGSISGAPSEVAFEPDLPATISS
jgi:peroxiredoxin